MLEGNFDTPTKIDIQYADEHVLFDISDCTLNKKYSLCNLKRDDLKKFVSKLQYYRKLTWRKFGDNDRATGLTKERPGTESCNMIDGENSRPEKVVKRYYFHFRIGSQHSTFRVFGYQHKNAFCITHPDLKGAIHNH